MDIAAQEYPGLVELKSAYSRSLLRNRRTLIYQRMEHMGIQRGHLISWNFFIFLLKWMKLHLCECVRFLEYFKKLLGKTKDAPLFPTLTQVSFQKKVRQLWCEQIWRQSLTSLRTILGLFRSGEDWVLATWRFYMSCNRWQSRSYLQRRSFNILILDRLSSWWELFFARLEVCRPDISFYQPFLQNWHQTILYGIAKDFWFMDGTHVHGFIHHILQTSRVWCEGDMSRS